MNEEKYINHLIKEAEDSFNTLKDETPCPSMLAQKKDLKKYDCNKLRELARAKGYIFEDMLNAPAPFDLFPEEFKKQRFILYKMF